MSYTEQLQSIVTEYIGAGQAWPATTHEIAGWALRTGRWQSQPADVIDRCADELAHAMREEFIRDPQGRTIRAKHVARVKRRNKQMSLWGDIRTASHRHMEIAFRQRRNQIVGECYQLKNDVDSYNENYNKEEPIQTVFDFTDDLGDLAHSFKRRPSASEPRRRASQSQNAS